MPERPSLIERAFQIADSGSVADTTELRKVLQVEGYGSGMMTSTLSGRSIRTQLQTRIKKARTMDALLRRSIAGTNAS